MPKISRTRMTRGTKVVTQHMTDVANAAATVINNVQFDRENLVNNYGTCRVNFHIPVMDAIFWKYAGVVGQGIDFALPFALPPLQEFFSNSGVPTSDTPNIILDEFTLSFDQRAEACALISETQGGVGGQMNYVDVTRLNINVALVEKPQRYFGNDISYTPEREVFSATIPAAAFASEGFRANPFILSDLGKAMSPYKTYALMLSCPELYNTAVPASSLCLPALSLSMKFRHPLVRKDQEGQNMPNGWASKVAPTVTLFAPNPNAIIVADGNTGVQTTLNTIDGVFLNKLEGGTSWDSNNPPFESIDTDSTYEVIMVPMWQNIPQGAIGFRPDTMYVHAMGPPDSHIPYLLAVPFTEVTCDRRIIPLPFPITIHHVIAIANYGSPGGPGLSGTVPGSATLVNTVGVGINTGLRSDYIACDQVALVQWYQWDKDTIRIDQFKARPQGTLCVGSYDFELFSVPLVGADGNGYYPQGKPVFAGMSNTNTQGRSTLGGSTPSGREQFLEVRWSIHDANGLDTIANGGAATDDTNTFVGYGGNWVQIIGKKTAVVSSGDIPRV